MTAPNLDDAFAVHVTARQSQAMAAQDAQFAAEQQVADRIADAGASARPPSIWEAFSGGADRADREPRMHVTELWCPAPDDGVQRLHSPRREPEREPELEL